jgi:hypothetical protein
MHCEKCWEFSTQKFNEHENMKFSFFNNNEKAQNTHTCHSEKVILEAST